MNKLSKNILTICILSVIFPSLTNAKNQSLPIIEIQAQDNNRLNTSQIILNNKDLTRYETDVSVPQIGRFGNRGFNIRGAENNQIAITVDGIPQAESHDYAAFRRYSYYNSSRPVIDNELISSINIKKGADSTTGALGGSVNYMTKNINDILLENRKVGASIKNTYNGQNREWINTLGMAFNSQYFDGLAIYSHRYGHENQINSTGPDTMGSGRGLPDPYTHYQYSYLTKLGFKPHPEHRFELKSLKQRSKNIGKELSYSAITLRDFHDIQQTESHTIGYQYTPQNSSLEQLAIHFNQQDSQISGHNTQKSISSDQLTDDTLRQFNQKNQQIDFSIASKPITLKQQHQLSSQLGYTKQKFDLDIVPYITGIAPIDIDLQQPVEQKKWFITLGDRIQFNPHWSAHLNAHYTHQNYHSQQADFADTKYNLWATQAKLNYHFNPDWTISYQLSRGFRAPTASEMYFNRTIAGRMGIPNQHFLANPHLKPETSLNHEISLEAHSQFGHLKAVGYYNHYQDFIDLVTLENFHYQSQNINQATVKGLDLTADLNLNHIWSALPDGLTFNTGLGYAQGKRDDHASLLSIQPLKFLFSLGYTAPQNDWSVRLQGIYTQAKKARDAQEYAITAHSGYLTPAKQLSTYPYLSHSATIFDLIGHKNFGKQTKVQFGIYNLFNQKYATWDSLRTIGSTNITIANSVSGEGLNRYLEPKRYMMMSVEYKF